jgi:hypothetical protein
MLLRSLVAFASACAALWCAFWALNMIYLHGFATNCSIGHPDFDPAYCGITWQPGFPYLLLGTLSLLVLVASVWERAFTRVVLTAVGLTSVVLALLFLWLETWEPVNPAHREPAGPQLVLLAIGVAAVLFAAAFPRLRRGPRHVVPRNPYGQEIATPT